MKTKTLMKLLLGTYLANTAFLAGIVAIFTLTTSCGKKYTPLTVPSDAEYSEEVQEVVDYIENTLLLPTETPILLTNTLQGNRVGVCRTKGSDWLILISKRFWDNRGYTGRLALLLHEILHCDYDLEHTEDGPNLMAETIQDSMQCIIFYGEKKCLELALEE